MIYKVASFNDVSHFIQDEIAAYQSTLQSLDKSSADERTSIREGVLHARTALSLAETALYDGRASIKLPNDEHPNALIAFVRRGDGLLRCFACDDYEYEFSLRDSSYDVAHIDSCERGVKVFASRLDREIAAHDRYGAAYYGYALAFKKAVLDALRCARDTGRGEANVVIDGDMIQRIEAVRENDVIHYTVDSQVLQQLFQ